MSDTKERIHKRVFEVLINCILRELKENLWRWDTENRLLLNLPNERGVLEVEFSKRSTIGLSVVATARRKKNGEHVWNELYEDLLYYSLEAVFCHLREKIGMHFQYFQHILTHVFASIHEIEEALHVVNGEKCCTFRNSEQNIVFGHWFHPIAKSNFGFQTWHSAYKATGKQRFKLYYFQVEKELLKERHVDEGNCLEDMLPLCREEISEREGMKIVALHPVQAEWLMQQKDVKKLLESEAIVALGLRGEYVYPTSSVRTVCCVEGTRMYKFSLPVKLTNSVRMIKKYELDAGIEVGKLLRSVADDKVFSHFIFIEDSSYASIPSIEGFELIVRQNPIHNDDATMAVVALLHQDLDRNNALKAFIEEQVILSGDSIAVVAKRWFTMYLQRMIGPILYLYDTYGIALEAHMQNCLITLDSIDCTCFFRDNQGYYLSESAKKSFVAKNPNLHRLQQLFYPDEIIQKRLTYYLFYNQCFAVVQIIAEMCEVEESDILKLVNDFLEQQNFHNENRGIAFRKYILYQTTHLVKANLLSTMLQMDELTAAGEAIEFVNIPNPFLIENEKKPVLLHG
ncbi:MAG: IucA/IucC family protein [Bacilli bacterium]